MLLALAVSTAAVGCPYDPKDPLLRLRASADSTVVKVEVTGPNGCDNVGTGFFVSAQGHILTADHVIPAKCTNAKTAIDIWWTELGDTKQSGPFAARVVARSKFDVVALKLEAAPEPSRRFLAARLTDQDTQSLRNSCVLLASRESRQPDTYSTFAEIVSVSLEGDKRWSVSGEGFNSERSGSPVILRSGEVAAIFVGRPTDPSDRDNIIFSRATVVPLALIPKVEIDLGRLTKSPGNLSAFPPSTTPTAKSPRTSFGISVTESGGRISPDLPNFFVSSDGALQPAPSDLITAGTQALIERRSLVRRINVAKQFSADPGFVFDPTTIDYSIASMNPPKATLPRTICGVGVKENCLELTKDLKSLTVNMWMYPGIDGRRAWVDAEMRVNQKPE